MSGTIERIQIKELHGRKNIEATLSNNTLILVGENGSGKTTFLRILFYFLSGRWLGLIQFRFESIVVTIDGHEYRVTHEELVKAFKGADRRILADLPPMIRRKVMEIFERGEPDRIAIQLERLSARYPIQPEIILRQLEYMGEKPRGIQKNLQDDLLSFFVTNSKVSLRFKHSDFATVPGLLEPVFDCRAKNAAAR
nr:AAA family ATPase [Nitrosospira sp.]